MNEQDEHNDTLNREAFRRLSRELRSYIEKRFELMATDLNGQFSMMASIMVLRMIGLIILLFGVFFLLYALARYLGDLLNNISLGFLLASIPLFVAGISLALLRPRRLLHRIRLQFFRQFMQMVSYIIPQNLPEKVDQPADKKSQSMKKQENRDD